MNMTTQDFELMVADYVADPNCRPYLWISYETPSETERQHFVNDPRVKAAHLAAVLASIKK